MPTSLEARNWRIGGGNERLNMRTTMDCAWMLDGVIKDRVCALILASSLMRTMSMHVCLIVVVAMGQCCFQELRVYMRWEPYGWIGPEGRDDERNEIVMGLESTPHSKFYEPPIIESIRWVTELIRFHPVFKFNVQNALRIDSNDKKHDFQGFSKIEW
ncbi:hypothetical protein PIB30_060149 [Stylosanthes scabra]|uniref:Uncharacterized protein n=1 Tax=Stylosanthes scabra TaxID=79078 RepID=A0ABU6TM37_9FABA|nr:hypothetical protein [Stylosanthes scabra]